MPDEFIVAIAVFELLHEPPGVVLLKVVVELTHTLVMPVIAAGRGLTVAVVVAELEHKLLLVTVSV